MIERGLETIDDGEEERMRNAVRRRQYLVGSKSAYEQSANVITYILLREDFERVM